MDYRQPVTSLIPGVQGRLLAALAGTTQLLNLRTLARLSGVSPAQASRVLPDLVQLGLVEREEVPPAALFRLVEGNLAADIVRGLAELRRAALAGLGRLATGLEPRPEQVVIYGSLATGVAGPNSDVDVLLVRGSDVHEDDERWHDAVDRFRHAGRLLTGNPLSVMELSLEQVHDRLRSGQPLWRDIAAEGVVVHGPPLPGAARLARG